MIERAPPGSRVPQQAALAPPLGRLLTAWDAHDQVAVAEAFAPDGEMVISALPGGRHVGRAGIAEVAARVIEYFPGLRLHTRGGPRR